MGAWTARALAEEWVRARRARGEIAASTAASQAMILRHFTGSYGARPIEQLARVHVEAWLEERRRRCRPGTVRNEWAVVHGWCDWLVEKGRVRRHPMVGMPRPRVPRPGPRALDEDQVVALLAVLPDARARVIVLLGLSCALRCGEIAGLEIGDIDWRARTIHVHNGVKGGHPRIVPMPGEVADAVRAYLRRHPTAQGPLVRSYRPGSRPVAAHTIGAYVSRWMAAAGVKERPHDGRSAHALRHTSAVALVEVEPDVRVAQQLLGHVSPATTWIYLRSVVGGPRLAEAMSARWFAQGA